MNLEKIKFILYKGVFVWGVSTATIWSICMTFLYSGKSIFNTNFFLNYFSTALILFPLGGFICGLISWNKKK